MNPFSLRLVATIALCLALGGLCGAVKAQTQPASDSDLRKQNQQLQSRIDDLERELKAAKDRVKQLEQDLAAAKKSTSSASSTSTAGTPLDERISIDESVPAASPRALQKALIASYEKDPGKIDMGKDGDGKRHAYMRRLEGWKATVEREFRGPIKWFVRMVGPGDPPFINGNEVLRFVAVDPETGVQLGGPFDVSLTRTLSDRIADLQSKGELDVLVLRGILSPIVIVNPDRTTRGSFDNPPFIGPFAEMNFSINVQSLLPAKDADKEPPATTKPAVKPAVKPAASAKPPGKPAEKP